MSYNIPFPIRLTTTYKASLTKALLACLLVYLIPEPPLNIYNYGATVPMNRTRSSIVH